MPSPRKLIERVSHTFRRTKVNACTHLRTPSDTEETYSIFLNMLNEFISLTPTTHQTQVILSTVDIIVNDSTRTWEPLSE